ncbi:Dimodular nonribosomal peptide synthase [Mycobacterium attenuatum]|uniref:condensation domain-containing protein n=1 Tax=Mycobacterium attenuatum TaxID=2341086 RepID=UPI000F042233|nr:condensation domain-containing protein [Mycobacterium attenuatum]VBA52198.1 Dimodular nonribosomal peptide synthase [Mycobacterium attenuatum]
MRRNLGALPLTCGQSAIYLSQSKGYSVSGWQASQFVVIKGSIVPALLRQAICHAISEAEPVRAGFIETDGKTFQAARDHPDIDLPFWDFTRSPDPAQEAHRMASSIQQTPMPLEGPLFRFALFLTGLNEYFFFMCFHHLVIDAFSIGLLTDRIASVYSAIAGEYPIPKALFGSLHDLVACEAKYGASKDYLADLAYWKHNLPARGGSDDLPTQMSSGPSYLASAPVALDSSVVNQIGKSAHASRIRRASLITAACALMVHELGIASSEVVFNFPVARRTNQQLKNIPGMLFGVIPLVLRVCQKSSVASYCRQVDMVIRNGLKHQRFPVYLLEREYDIRSDRSAERRVTINFVPSANSPMFSGAPASTLYTTVGHSNYFDLMFTKHDAQVLLSTAGTGLPFSDFTAPELVGKLERLLLGLTIDTTRQLSSMTQRESVVDGPQLRLPGELPAKALLPNQALPEMECSGGCGDSGDGVVSVS